MHYTPILLLAQLLFYPRCWGCGQRPDTDLLWCVSCRNFFRFHYLFSHRALFPYEGPAVELLAALRQQPAYTLAFWTAELWFPPLEALVKAEKLDTLVLAPSRSYSRSAWPIIAGKLARELGLQWEETVLFKKRGHYQHGRDREARVAGGRFLFPLPRAPKFMGRRVLLLDDLLVSGTTLGQAELCLRELGAESVEKRALAEALPK